MGSQLSFCCRGMRIKEETEKVPPPRTVAPCNKVERGGERVGEEEAEGDREERGWQAKGEQEAGKGGEEKRELTTAVPGTLTACCHSSSSEAVTGLWMPLD